MILLNFAHPLTPDHLARIEALTGQQIEGVINIPCQIDTQQPLIPQVLFIADACDLSPTQWQTLSPLVNPPALNFIAVALLAELHGRCGHFPTILRLRPVPDSTPTRFEVAELINLQDTRDAARQRRGDETTA